MLLDIYLGTAVISLVTTFILTTISENKLKARGYKFFKEEKLFLERIPMFISNVIIGIVPIYNILNTVVILCMGDNFYEYMECKLLEKGKIYKPKIEDLNNKSESPDLNQKKDVPDTVDVQSIKSNKTISEMTVGERLACFSCEGESFDKLSSSLGRSR